MLEISYVISIAGLRTVETHRDNDHAVFRDDLVGELVEGGVRVVIERFQLLDEVVQLDEGPEGLALVRPVDGRGEELQHGVVLTVSLLADLKEQKNADADAGIQIDASPHTNTHAVKKKGTTR